MSRDGGHVLVELLVASVCAALVGAAALTLLVNGAAASTRARDRVDRVALARACRDVLQRNLQQAFDGLEGVDTLHAEGGLRHRMEPRSDGAVLLQPVEDAAEVAVDADGSYRIATARARGALVPGALVVALPARGRVAVLGKVVAIDTTAAGTRLHALWPSGAAPRLPLPVRALVPVRWREVAFTAGERGIDLRRRDEGGNWQPVVEGLAGVELAYAVDRDGSGVANPPFAPWNRATLPVAAGFVRCLVDDGAVGAAGWAWRQ